MPARFVDDAKHWHDRAAEMRALAAEMNDLDTRVTNVEAGGRLREACPARGERCEQAAKLKVAFEIVVQRRNKRAPLAFRSYPGMCIA
jgi:hypothetical protein